jgi:outer membrane immunogenic protein
MKKVVLTAAVLVASAGMAFSADLPARVAKPAPYIAPPVFTWTGFYVGANVGYGFSRSRDVNMVEVGPGEGEGGPGPAIAAVAAGSSLPGTYGSLSPKGIFGGLQAGYNYQFGQFVLGVESDIQVSGIRDRVNGYDNNTEYTLATKSEVNWFGTLRPRVGYAFDNVLIYATGGLAFGGVKYAQEFYCCGSYYASARADRTKFGYAVGGGLEYAVSSHWTVKAEYQYINLGSANLSATEYNPDPTPYSVHTRLRSNFHTVRLGVNYRF